ncbi:hypothetical protein C7C45_32805 [Micromonospora arborensis]|uniref:Uncharacterized protein n=1 Tax=Micromonospora arborensis TaxID=2116518 RepID=A0A318NJH1_9ACTN|nr:hypothetical protein C7C45_32805 [Micromonospora arborensis]
MCDSTVTTRFSFLRVAMFHADETVEPTAELAVTAADPTAEPADATADPTAEPAVTAADPTAEPADATADPTAEPADATADPTAGTADATADVAAGTAVSATHLSTCGLALSRANSVTSTASSRRKFSSSERSLGPRCGISSPSIGSRVTWPRLFVPPSRVSGLNEPGFFADRDRRAPSSYSTHIFSLGIRRPHLQQHCPPSAPRRFSAMARRAASSQTHRRPGHRTRSVNL